MDFRLLEPVTYTQSLPQFTPINYIMYSEGIRIDSTLAAILLSELPVIFKKYNVPLYRHDLNLWVNSEDNIANGLEITNVLYNGDQRNQEEVLFTKEFFDFYKKISSLKNDDKAIEELINKRYGYYYNKYDKDANAKFINFLNEQIRLWGQIPTFEYNADNLKMTTSDKYEQEARDYFYKIKNVFHNVPVVFLSKRIEKVYEVLANKYPEISFNKYYSCEESMTLNRRINCVYVNDINYELIPKMNPKNYIPRLNIEPNTYRELPDVFVPKSCIEKLASPYPETTLSIRRKKQLNGIENKIMRYSPVNILKIIDWLETERQMLENSGVEDAIELLPTVFQEYFYFCLHNSEQIEYFKAMIDVMKKNNEQNRLSFDEIKRRTVEQMIEDFGKEMISEKLIKILLESHENSPWLHHQLIAKNTFNKKTPGYQKLKV